VGDDEFVMVLENLEETGPAASVATSLLDMIKEPYEVLEHEVFVEGCIGISTFPKDGQDIETLKNNAYTAMKRAKKSLREDIPRFRFYSDEINKQALKRLLSEKDLRNALTQEKFELHYQPRIDFKTGRIIAVEALIRWRREGEGLIMPNSFIPLAERSGLINDIGAWVLKTACEQVKDWKNAGLTLPRMSINLSPRQFMQHDLLGMITRILDDAGLEPRDLELEITENSLIKDTDRCIEIITDFRLLGGTVSIDDFGTGYSSLSYLKNFPVDILKIDKVFIQDITTEPDHAAITLAVISMAHSLNLQVVAEGVEQESEFDFLRSKGCDELQGYFFSKPKPAAEITEMLENKHCLKIDEIKNNASTTLLLIDDDSETLSRMSIMLRDEGYRILMAQNGEEALKLLSKNAVGVVVSDEFMPSIKGSQLLKKIKFLYDDSVRILMSANADRDAIITGINSGAIFKFLNKPISEADLKNTLKEAFIMYKTSQSPVQHPGQNSVQNSVDKLMI
jgi:EAL domain-containing protein (putative c-di-GMP-specific phosphodiesterase class I)/CheY-like chemotaxis protein